MPCGLQRWHPPLGWEVSSADLELHSPPSLRYITWGRGEGGGKGEGEGGRVNTSDTEPPKASLVPTPSLHIYLVEGVTGEVN